MTQYAFLSEGEVWKNIEERTDIGDYRERTKDVAPMGIGAASTMTYLHGGGRRFPRQSYLLGALIGVNTRIVDDLLDGDGCAPVTKREEFMERYISSFSSGEKETPVETEVEAAAYTAAEILHSQLAHYDADVVPPMVERLENMKDLVVDEDKSTVEGYRKYTRGAGGEHGALIAVALDIFPDCGVDQELIDFAYDMGYGIQVADDRYDDDIELDREELEELYQEAVDSFSEHDGIVPRLLPKLDPVYAAINRASNVAKTVKHPDLETTAKKRS